MALMGLSSKVTAMMRSSSNKRACSGSNAGVVAVVGVLLVLVLVLLLCLRNRLMLAVNRTFVDLVVLLMLLLLILLLRLCNAKAARVALEAAAGRSAKPWHVRTNSKERAMVARLARV